MGFDLAEAVRLLPTEDQENAMRRIQTVQAAQRRLGMEPRNDSRLTFNYAVGLLEDAEDIPSAVANELVVVDRIFRETNYSSIVEAVLREIAAQVKQRYRISWTDTWDIVRFYGPVLVKLHCIKTLSTFPAPST